MNTLTKTFAIAAITAGISGGALAQSSHGHNASDGQSSMKMMDTMMPKPDDTASTKDFKEAHMRMMKTMDVPFSGDPDVDFRRHMIPHHQGAIDMAEVALKHARDADTKKMAQKIIDDQKKEIAEMQAWLKSHGK